MAQMGMGCAILGYSDDDVNKAVMNAIEGGVNTTLNAPEEVAFSKITFKFESIRWRR